MGVFDRATKLITSCLSAFAPQYLRSTWRRLAILSGLTTVIAGCVTIVAPTHQATFQSTTVQAEVGFRSQVCAGTFTASLDGNDVTNDFNPQPPAQSRPQATFSSLALGQHTLTVSAETLQFWLLIPFCSRASDTVTFVVANPALGFNPSGINVTVGTSSNVTVTLSAPRGAATAVSLSSSNPGAVTVPASTAIPANVTSSPPVAVTAHAPGTSTVTAFAAGLGSAALGVSVPTPDFRVDVTPGGQAVAWGDSATYTVGVESLNGFSMPVSLSAIDLPEGSSASFSPTSVTPPMGGTASAILTVTTTEGVTAPGTTRFRTAGNGGSRTRRDDADITVLRTPGTFGANVYPLRSGNSSCGPVTATVVAAGGPRVQFSGPLGTTNPAPRFGAGYDFSSASKCRVGFVIPPIGATPFVNLYNLRFPPSTGASGVNSPYNFAAVAIEARFSPDDSIVAIIGPAGTGTPRAFSINLFDVVQRRSSGAAFFDGVISNLTLAGDQVTVTGSDSNGPFAFTMSTP